MCRAGCGGCVAGVSRACGGCVRGASAGCARGWMEAVCPGARDSPPRRGSAASSFFPRDEWRRRALRLLRVSSTRVARLPLPADCPRGLPLFPRLAAAVPHPRESLCASPGTRAAVPLGPLLPPLFPGDSKTRNSKDTQQRHARRFFIPHRTRNSKFHPPAKNTPPTLGDPAHDPEWMSGVHLGVCALGRRPPSCALGVLLACRASSFGFSTAFQTARRQGGASKRRAGRCL